MKICIDEKNNTPGFSTFYFQSGLPCGTHFLLLSIPEPRAAGLYAIASSSTRGTLVPPFIFCARDMVARDQLRGIAR